MAKRSKKKQLADLPSESDAQAPLDSALLLSAAMPVLKGLEADLLLRARDSLAVTGALQARHQLEVESRRSADGYDVWLRHFVEQVAAAWLLSCVFVRTLEDRGLLAHRRIAGPGAADAQRTFLQLAPSLSERDYLLTVFRELMHLPAAKGLFDAAHNPIWLLAPSSVALKPLLELLRTPTPDAPALRFGQPSTRFLGDLYQDLNENVRKRYALLQTPDFIEAFILDRTLEPAIEKFGLDETTLIDPTCGSGHFLLGAFERLVDHRLRSEPGLAPAEAARKALDAVFGADINAYAVAVARFRLTLAYLDKAGFKRLADAPELPLHVVVADSLLHNAQLPQAEFGQRQGQSSENWGGASYALEDEEAARGVLHRRFAAVVGNPPYITPKDRALRTSYAKSYSSCFMNYALSVPFAERFFQLGREGGRVGMITANSFMKREFGKKLIQDYLPTVDLDLIVNTSGAYIPGHGTPTVLLFGACAEPSTGEVLTVLAKRGEPKTPADPAQGEVWSSIAANWAEVGFENDYISVARVPREALKTHPWSLAGGGAGELKTLLEERAVESLGKVVEDIGFSLIIGEDEVFIRPKDLRQNRDVPRIELVVGEEVRDWSLSPSVEIIRPFDAHTLEVHGDPRVLKTLWPWRARLQARIVSGSTSMEQAGKPWYDVRRLSRAKHRTPLSITFAFVATHNHFVLDRGGKVFNRSAPIIKLPADASEDDHYALLAYLNSSTACFWMKQVFQPKHSAEHKTHPEPERNRYEHAGTQMNELPLPPNLLEDLTLANAARELTALATEQAQWTGGRATGSWREFDGRRERMIALQEEVDWRVYELFGLAAGVSFRPSLPTSVTCPRGQRPMERLNGRKSFVRRRDHLVALAIAEAPPVGRLPAVAESVWKAREAQLMNEKALELLEHPLFKRQWRDTDDNVVESDFRAGLEKSWVARTVLQHAESVLKVACDTVSMQQLSRAGDSLTEPLPLGVTEISVLVEREAIPFLAAATFTASGLEKHAAWQRTWALQRREDAGEDVGAIPVPPKYGQKDFSSAVYWRLRGKLDVPKERFISYPGCASDEDGEPIYGWAGWDHLQRAQALVALYQDRKAREGWPAERLTPLLAGLLELLPWLLQWHDAPDAEHGGERPAQEYKAFLESECRLHGLSHDDLRAWRPTDKKKPRRKKK